MADLLCCVLHFEYLKLFPLGAQWLLVAPDSINSKVKIQTARAAWGPYLISKPNEQLITLETGEVNTPIVVLPPIPDTPGAQEWHANVLPDQTVTIGNISYPDLFLSFRGEPQANSQIEALPVPREWQLKRSSSPDHYFIVVPGGAVDGQELVVDLSLLRIFPPRLALHRLRPDADDLSQAWKFEFLE